MADNEIQRQRFPLDGVSNRVDCNLSARLYLRSSQGHHLESNFSDNEGQTFQYLRRLKSLGYFQLDANLTESIQWKKGPPL
jgi:hypothetical protein